MPQMLLIESSFIFLERMETFSHGEGLRTAAEKYDTALCKECFPDPRKS